MAVTKTKVKKNSVSRSHYMNATGCGKPKIRIVRCFLKPRLFLLRCAQIILLSQII